MQIMIKRRKRGSTSKLINAIHPEPQLRLVTPSSVISINFAVERLVVDMDLTGTDADDGTVFFVQPAALEHELAFAGVDVVVELVEVGYGCETGAGDVSDSGVVETVYDDNEDIGDSCKACEAESLWDCEHVEHGSSCRRRIRIPII